MQLSRARLRPFRVGDGPSIAYYADNPRVWRNLRDSFPHPYTMADAEQWIARVSGSERDFAIDVGGRAVGGLGLRPGEDVWRRSAEIGYWLGEEHWGQGIMTEAVQAATAYAFRAFQANRLWAGVFAWNPASARVLEKAGYELEGRLRQAVVKDGAVVDELVYAIVR